LFLDTPSQGREITCYTQIHGRAVRKIKLFLNNTLSVRSPPDDCPPIPILYSPRYDFASRGRVFINKNDQLSRCEISALRTIGVIFMSLFMRPLRIDNKPSISKKLASHFNRHVKISTTIVAQIKNEFLRSLLFQLNNRLFKLCCRINPKSPNLDITNTRFNHINHIQRTYRYLITHHFNRCHHLLTIPLNVDIDFRSSTPPAQLLHTLPGNVHTCYALVPNLQQLIPHPKTRLIRRTTINQGNNHQRIVEIKILHTNTLKCSLQNLRLPLGFIRN